VKQEAMGEASIDEVDKIMAELGLSNEPKTSPAKSSPAVSGEEQAVDALMADLGVSMTTTVTPPKKISTGPGRGRGVSTGPGVAWSGKGRGVSAGPGRGQPMATTTPDGRAIQHSGPPCATCNQMIIGQCINALEKTYHPECFVCTSCNRSFPGGSFLEFEGKPYCEMDYNDLFSPRCMNCKQSIMDKCITVSAGRYHSGCFNCTGCGVNLTGKTFRESDGDIFCTSCMQSKQQRIPPPSELCARCKKPITGEFLVINGQKVHPEHYRCEECGADLKGGDCRDFEGHLYCNECYQKMRKSICASCHKPILGRSITALGRVWHPEHFVCFVCHDPFTTSSFFEHEGKPYCQTHYAQQFGDPCSKCGRPVVAEALHFLDKVYHKEHFTCTACDTLLRKGNINEWEGKPMCQGCYKKLPEEVRKRVGKKREAEEKLAKKKAKEEKALEKKK